MYRSINITDYEEIKGKKKSTTPANSKIIGGGHPKVILGWFW